MTFKGFIEFLYSFCFSLFVSLFFIAVLFQLPHSSLNPSAFWVWAESTVLEGARRLETLCRSVEDTLNAPVVQVGTDGAEIVVVS